MSERDFRIEILQGYLNIRRIVTEGERTKYLLLLLTVSICVFGIGPRLGPTLKIAADSALAVSAAIFIALLIAVTRISISTTVSANFEQLASELRAQQRLAKVRHRFLQVAALLLLVGMITAMVGVTLR